MVFLNIKDIYSKSFIFIMETVKFRIFQNRFLVKVLNEKSKEHEIYERLKEAEKILEEAVKMAEEDGLPYIYLPIKTWVFRTLKTVIEEAELSDDYALVSPHFTRFGKFAAEEGGK